MVRMALVAVVSCVVLSLGPSIVAAQAQVDTQWIANAIVSRTD